MLTIYNRQSGFKKKFTVVVIWLIAIAMFYFLVNFLINTEISMGLLIVPAIISFIVIAAILLRCKVGRAFTLVGVYTLMLLPFVPLFTNTGAIHLTQAIYFLLFGILAIYVFSNEKAMDIYYIESNPKEHILYALVAAGLIALYAYFIGGSLLN